MSSLNALTAVYLTSPTLSAAPPSELRAAVTKQTVYHCWGADVVIIAVSCRHVTSFGGALRKRSNLSGNFPTFPGFNRFRIQTLFQQSVVKRDREPLIRHHQKIHQDLCQRPNLRCNVCGFVTGDCNISAQTFSRILQH